MHSACEWEGRFGGIWEVCAGVMVNCCVGHDTGLVVQTHRPLIAMHEVRPTATPSGMPCVALRGKRSCYLVCNWRVVFELFLHRLEVHEEQVSPRRHLSLLWSSGGPGLLLSCLRCCCSPGVLLCSGAISKIPVIWRGRCLETIAGGTA